MSETSRILQEKSSKVRKNGKKNLEASLVSNHVEEKRAWLSSSAKKIKSGLGKSKHTKITNSANEMTNLIAVERNYVKELIKIPEKFKSNSPKVKPILKKKSPNKIKLSQKHLGVNSALEIITLSSKRLPDSKKLQISLTPEIYKRNKRIRFAEAIPDNCISSK